MRVFLSWSGAKSLAYAQSLRDWLPLVLNSLEPWLSNADLDPGRRWERLLGERLQDTDVGLVLCTPDNLESQWLLFEAGALAKSADKARVIPVCIGVEKKDLPAPLSMFQGIEFSHEGIFDAIRSLASMSGVRLSSEQLRTIVDHWWPKLADATTALLTQLPTEGPSEGHQRKRADRDLLEEILLLARQSREPTKEDIVGALVKWEARLRETAARAFKAWDEQDAPTGQVADRLEELADTVQDARQKIESIANHAP